MNNFLRENFQVSGTEKDEFFALCKELDDVTVYVKATAPELASFLNEQEDGIHYEGILAAFTELENALGDANEAEALYNELLTTKAPVIKNPVGSTGAFLSTNKAVAEIAALRGLHGSPINIPTINRDKYVTELAKNLKVTFVCRKANNVARIMSTRSDKFGPICMETLKQVFDGFMSSDWVGSYEEKKWEMTQDEGYIYLEFPGLAANMKAAYPNVPDNWVPGVIFRNGTTGYCTLSATMTYRLENSYNVFEVGNVAAKHFAGFTPEAFIKRMQNECWGLYTRMPEALEKMTQINIEPEDVEATLEKVFKFIRLNKVFQKKDTETCRYLESIRKRALNDCGYIADPTLYDIITVVMNIAESVSVPDAYKELLKNACGRAWQYEA